MKIASKTVFGQPSNPGEWDTALREIERAISRVVWPEGSKEFAIHPQSGKKRGEGNGVKPIHERFLAELSLEGWLVSRNRHKLDGVRNFPDGYIGLEWETGNISSSHRSLNRLALAQREDGCLGGVLILPTRKLAQYLTDRIGNYEEIAKYLQLYEAVTLAVYAIEHDREDFDVPRIKKGTDGRSRA